MLASKAAMAAAGELKTSSIAMSFIHRDVSQSWLKKTSIDCAGRLSSNNSSPDSTCKPFQCLHQPLKTTCKGAALNSCGSTVKLNLSERPAEGSSSPNFMAEMSSMGSTGISTSSLDQSKPHCSIRIRNSSSEKLPMAKKGPKKPLAVPTIFGEKVKDAQGFFLLGLSPKNMSTPHKLEGNKSVREIHFWHDWSCRQRVFLCCGWLLSPNPSTRRVVQHIQVIDQGFNEKHTHQVLQKKC